MLLDYCQTGVTLRSCRVDDNADRIIIIHATLLWLQKIVTVSIELAPEELTIIRNALNEVCNGVELHGE